MPKIDQPIYGEFRPRIMRIVFDKGPTDPEHPAIPEEVFIEGFNAGAFANKAAAVANSTAADVAGLNTKFNELLAKLRTAGLLAE